MSRTREKELRCFCSRKPLLATYGIKDGKLFVHVKIYKAKRIFGEFVIEGGIVKLRCRDCKRWHKIRLVQDKAVLEKTEQILPVTPIG